MKNILRSPTTHALCSVESHNAQQKCTAADSGADGIVVEVFGWGNVNEPVYEAIKYAMDQGVPVVISTRVHNGRTLPIYGFKGGGKTLREIGAVFGDDLSPWKARILLMLTLPQTKVQEALQKYFSQQASAAEAQ